MIKWKYSTYTAFWFFKVNQNKPICPYNRIMTVEGGNDVPCRSTESDKWSLSLYLEQLPSWHLLALSHEGVCSGSLPFCSKFSHFYKAFFVCVLAYYLH